MASFNTISIRFNADLKQFSSQMQNAQRSMQKYGKQMQSIGQGLTLGVTLPVLGLGAAAVKAASDAEETAAKFDTVFRDISDSANKAADELRNSYGLSGKASKQLLSDTGDLLTGFGFSQDAALDLSSEVNKLAVDLASFTNFSGGAEGASQALTKALLGERESVKSLGISILEADVKAKMLEQAQEGLTFETERQAKAFATLTIAQEQSKNAIGDYARTSDSFANQMRLLKARLNDVAVEFGEILLPYVSKLADFVGKLINKFSELSPATKKIITVVGLLAAAIGPILIVVGTLASTALPALTTAFTVLTGPIGLVIAALAGIAYVVYQNWDKIQKYVVDLKNYFIDLYNESVIFRVGIEQIIFAFKTTWEIVKLVFGSIWDIIKNTGNFIVETFKNAGAAIKAVLTRDFDAIPGIFKKQNGLLKKNFSDTFSDIGDQIGDFTDNMQKNFNNAIDNVTKRKKIEFVKENIDTKAVEEKVAEAVQNGLTKGGTGAGGRAQVSTVSTLEMQGPEQLRSPLEDLTAELPDQASFIDEQMLKIQERMIKMREVGQIVGQELNGAFRDFSQGFIDSLGLANDGFQGFVKNMISTVTKLISMMLAQSISQAIAGATASGTATGPAAVFTTPGFIATAVGGVLSAFAAIPKFADGGLVYGPTVGLMGEYSGAKNNPEVIAPLDKLKGMISDAVGGGGGQVEFKLRGQDLIGSLSRAESYKNRRG